MGGLFVGPFDNMLLPPVLGFSVSSQEPAPFSMGLSCLIPFLPFFFQQSKTELCTI